MKKEICRAITFINYHIPTSVKAKIQTEYSTMGFFDGMMTKALSLNYEKESLKSLWGYSLKKSVENPGEYSYQTVYCFSDDTWNQCSDEEFWDEKCNEKFPLTFVVFLQLKNYSCGEYRIEEQCKCFNRIVQRKLGIIGLSYTYGTIDKNDFVVCIKCRNYKAVVQTIKLLHGDPKEKIKYDVVYSYTVFSISNQILENIEKDEFSYIWSQKIDSICLKGITNSFDEGEKIALDQKYRRFYEMLVDKLYVNEPDKESRLYDILGDNDFRFIARDVSLGGLLKELAPGGLLYHENENFSFSFFSSNLMLNMMTDSDHYINAAEFPSNIVQATHKAMEKEFVAPRCDALKGRMKHIFATLTDGQGGAADEKTVSYCYALCQILQSLTALERAPAKKYDFYTLYAPFSFLVDMLELNAENADSKDFPPISDEVLFDFIHKISMTLHGTLRTDIQFFQIRDFNAIVHYAPAKLRAFYAQWVLSLSEFYNNFCVEKNMYSFIFSPGMFPKISIKPLNREYKGKRRLMLIKVPERHLYEPKNLCLILSHEASHFVGYITRNREERHFSWLEIACRVVVLEIMKYRHEACAADRQAALETAIKNDTFLQENLYAELKREEKLIRSERGQFPHEFHSDNSIETIIRAFAEISKLYFQKILVDDNNCLRNALLDSLSLSEKRSLALKQEAEQIIYEPFDWLLQLFASYQNSCLRYILNAIRYITSEAYADMTAILTLGLTPENYIRSFFSTALIPDPAKEAREKDGLLLVVRTGTVLYALERTVNNNKEWFKKHNHKFFDVWHNNIISGLLKIFSTKPDICNFVVKVYGYVHDIRLKSDSICSYKSLFDFSEELFLNTSFDFLNDKIVWDCITGYLEVCAQSYIDGLSDATLYAERAQLEAAYQVVAGASANGLMQEIENYLEKFEKKILNDNSLIVKQ